MGGRRVHHEGTKGAKMQRGGTFRVAVCGAIVLLMAAAAFASRVRAQDRINPEELQRAAQYAAIKWEATVYPAASWDAPTRVTWQDIGLPWVHAALGMTISDLLKTNPGRNEDILAYINDALIPTMHEHRSEYICGYTRSYYGHTIFMAFAHVFEDPYQDIAYFVTPTRDYLQEHNLALSPLMQRELKRDARFSPDGSFWRSIAATRAHIPCDSGVDMTRKPLQVRP